MAKPPMDTTANTSPAAKPKKPVIKMPKTIGACADMLYELRAKRSAAQKIADELEAEGIFRFAANPHHRRARLVQLTERGAALFGAASARWRALADTLVAALGPGEVERAVLLLRATREQLQPPAREENAA